MLTKNIAMSIIASSARVSIPADNFIGRCVASLRESLLVGALKGAGAFTREDWGRIKQQKLSALVRHARKTVPRWKRVFGDLPDTPAEVEFSLEKIDISTRSLLKQLPIKEQIAQSIQRHRFVPTNTSGSTGEPFAFFKDEWEAPIRRATNAIEFYYNGLRFRQPALLLGLQAQTYLDPYGRRFSGRSGLEDEMQRREIYRFIREQQPQSVVTTPSLLDRLRHYFAKDKFEYQFGGIKTIGEELSREDQKAFSSFFGCRVFSVYGTRESYAIGIQCRENNFHIAEWLNYVEIVNQHGERLPIGAEGLVAVTYYENLVMPFIRYAVGDLGKFVTRPCPCGRTNPVIVFSGREPGTIPLPGGTAVSVLAVTTLVSRNYSQVIDRFQLQQDGNVLSFLFIPRTSFTERARSSLLNSLRDLFKHELEVRLMPVERILSFNDKTPLYIQRSVRHSKQTSAV